MTVACWQQNVELVHLAVTVHGKIQVNCLEHLNGLIVLVNGNGEGDSNLTAFRMLGIAQRRLDHIIHTLSSLLLVAVPPKKKKGAALFQGNGPYWYKY